MVINSICICGAGTMGSGIAQVSAQAGFHTLLYDLKPEALEKAKLAIEKNLDQLIEKGKLEKREKKKYYNGYNSRMISRPVWRMYLLKLL